jgi:peptidoglycan/LPS O-acetylase OafA/YrhL
MALSVFTAISTAALMVLLGARYGILTQRRLLGASLLLTVAHLFFLGALGLTLLLGTSGWKKLVNLPVLQFFGEIRYGFYLVHWLFFSGYDAIVGKYWPSAHLVWGSMEYLLLRLFCAAGLASIAALLSRRYFEDPFLRLKNRWSTT